MTATDPTLFRAVALIAGAGSLIVLHVLLFSGPWLRAIWRERQQQQRHELNALMFSDRLARFEWIWRGIGVLLMPMMWWLGMHAVQMVMILLLYLLIPRWAIVWLHRRRAQAIKESLPDALGALAGALRAGGTFVTSLQGLVDEQSGPLADEFTLALRELRLGSTLEEALDNLADRARCDDLDLFVSAVVVSQQVGGNLSQILDRLQETIKQRLDLERKIRTLTAQGVLQGRIVSVLPLLLALGLWALQPTSIHALFTTTGGWIVMAFISILQVFGALSIRRIVRIEP